jgi:hypothetical protein
LDRSGVSVRFGVMHRCMVGMLLRMRGVSVRRLGVVRSALVITIFVMFGSFSVMFGRLLVMLGRLLVVVRTLVIRHVALLAIARQKCRQAFIARKVNWVLPRIWDNSKNVR